MKKTILFILFISGVFTSYQSFGQQLNDLCLGATELTDLDNWCSSNGAYNNNQATPSSDPTGICWPSTGNDIWFRFTAQANSLSVSVEGATVPNPGGSLEDPQMIIYEGFCGDLTELACNSDAFGANSVETQIQNLIPGQQYFIRISARNDDRGSFKLCVNNFNAVPDPNGDCPTGVVLCDKSGFTVPSVLGEGNILNETAGTCLGNEFSSAWYKWTCDQSGSLTFVLSPLVSTDDLDFALFEMTNGIDDCSNLNLLRCMASGENVGAPLSNWLSCMGQTGLQAGSTDQLETPGCSSGDDNFLEPLIMESGKSYVLIINNFTNNGNGYTVDFGGSGTFLGPKLDFEIDPEGDVSCDVDTVSFVQAATIPAGMTANFTWYFGEGAQPSTATGPGPHEIVYNSFGDKSVVLQAETDAGCIVTDVTVVPILECCDPSFNLDLTLEDFGDPICYQTNSGFIEVEGTGGIPFYQYSIDGEFFQPVGSFVGLGAGVQTVYVQDIKGCIDSLDQLLVNPPPIIVDAGEQQVISLGETTFLNGFVNAPSPDNTSTSWILTDSLLACADCLDPEAFPVDDTYFYLEAVDDLGCSERDSVLVIVEKLRPIYIPNVFSPDFDGVNDNFTIYGNVAALEVKRLEIFDRWGNLVFQATNFPLSDNFLGWDGRINGEQATAGVYAFYTQIEFIDGVIMLYEGSITLMR